MSYVQPITAVIALRTHMSPSQVMWWPWHIVQKSGAPTHRCAVYHRRRLVYPDFLREGTVLRIRVSN